METSRWRLRDDLRIEAVGDETIVFDSSSGASLHRLTGDAVDALRLISHGGDGAVVPDRYRSALEELVVAGIVEDASQVTRRRALVTGGKGLAIGGATWATATVTTFALADPAAATTPCTSPGPTDPNATGVKNETPGTYTYITRPGQTTLLVRCLGGGGGGGGSNGGYTSGTGGGGGGYARGIITVTPCTTYSYVVGAGGAAGNKGDGGAGGDSYFISTSVMNGGGGGKGIGVSGSTGGAGGSGTATGTSTTTQSGGSGGGRASGTGCCNTNRGNGGGGGGGAGDSSGGTGGDTGDHGGGLPTGIASGGTGPPIGGTGGRGGGWAGTYSGTPGAAGGGGGGGASSGNNTGSAGGKGLVWLGI